MLNRAQYLTVFGALILFLVLYLGFSTTPSGQKVIEHSRSLQSQGTSFENLADNAKKDLSAEDAKNLEVLEQAVAKATADSDRINALKQLSGWWYRQGQIALSGGVAEEVAALENTDSAWSVAGATFFQALVGETDPILREFCASRALNAFESAISLNPDQTEHRVNQALVYAENPPKENPMKAVQLLRELENKYPENPVVYNALGRLAIKTGQWERAIQRLEKAWSLDPNNPNTPCLLARAYEGAGNSAKAEEFATRCKN